MNEKTSARQIELISWSELRSCGPGRRAVDVGDFLRQLLYSKDNDIVQNACARLENNVVPQGTLYECAPAVASVIMAGLSDGSIEPDNRILVLELLCFLLLGYPAESEIEAGCENLDVLVRSEVMKGYWSLLRLAYENEDDKDSQLAMESLEMLDEEHASRFLGARWNL